MGASVEIETCPGYMPLRSNETLAEIYERNLQRLHPETVLRKSRHRPSSTAAGNLSCIIPTLHAYSIGIEGKFHSCEFHAVDLVKACIEPAKVMAMSKHQRRNQHADRKINIFIQAVEKNRNTS